MLDSIRTWFSQQPHRSSRRTRAEAVFSPEPLEERRLLAADVDFSGSWAFMSAIGNGTLTVMQDGAKAHGNLTAGQLSTSWQGRVREDELIGRFKVGNVKGKFQLDYEPNTNPPTFTGEIDIKQKGHPQEDFDVTGTKQVMAAAAAADVSVQSNTENFAGTYTITFENGAVGTVLITQNGKNAAIAVDTNAFDLAFTAKIKGDDLKANFKVPAFPGYSTHQTKVKVVGDLDDTIPTTILGEIELKSKGVDDGDVDYVATKV